MNYHKALSNTLFGGFSRNEHYAISVYLMVYAQLESEPNDRRLRIWISDDEISFVRDFFNSDEGFTILSESVLEPLEYLNKKKELNKKRYSPENKKKVSRESPKNLQSVSRECQHDMTVHDMTVHDKQKTIHEKENKKEKFDFSNLTDDLKQAMIDFIEHRKTIKKPLTVNSFNLILKELDKLGRNELERIQILNQSIMNGWQGIFELKEQKTGGKGKIEEQKPVYKFSKPWEPPIDPDAPPRRSMHGVTQEERERIFKEATNGKFLRTTE